MGLLRVLGVASVCVLLAASCAWAGVLRIRPGTEESIIRVVSPSPGQQVAPDGTVDVQIALASGADETTFRAFLRSGSTVRDRWNEITAEFTVRPDSAVATIQTPEEGIAKLRVTVRGDRHRRHRRATTVWSWEPSLAAPSAGCDRLDGASCLLPFPSNQFTRPDQSSETGIRIDLRATVANSSGSPIDFTEWNRNDGFSPGTALLAHVPGVDLTQTGAAPITDMARSLEPDTPVVVIDAMTGQRHLNWVELDANATSEATTAIIVRPGVNFEEGHRYVVALRRLRDSEGTVIEPERLFRLYRDQIPTFDPTTEARRGSMENIFGVLRDAGIGRGDLYLAWDFTVASGRNLSERLLHMRDDAFGSLAGAAPAFTVSFVDDDVDSQIFRRVWGSFDVPLYLTGDGGPGSRLDYGGSTDVDALPVTTGTYTAPFVCNIPQSTTADGADPVTPARGTVYGHGTLGSFTEVLVWSQELMANESNMVYCATDWIGMSAGDIGHLAGILQDLSAFPTLVDRSQQGILNTLFLGRLLKDPNGFASDPAFQAGASATPVLVPGEVYFEGASQGGIMGGAATAVSTEWTSAVLGVPAMNYSTLLRRSIAFDTYALLINPAYPDELERALGFSLVQMLWDRGENNGYAHHMTDDPYPGTPAHRVLLHEAFGDHQVANVATEVMARTIGASVAAPTLAPARHHDLDPYFAIPEISIYPFGGSALVVWDSGNPAPPIENLAPRSPQHGTDPHEEPRYHEPARTQKSEFLRPDGVVIDVCEGAPCIID